MLTDGTSVSIPAGSTVNVFLGRPIEFTGQPSTAQLWATSDAAGMSAAMLVNVGGAQSAPIAAGTPINTAAAQGEGPKYDEDLLQDGIPLPSGARAQLNITNAGTGAAIMRWRALIRP